MKQSFWITMYIELLKMGRKIVQGRGNDRILILLPAESGSLGDEAIIKGTIDFLDKDKDRKFAIITYKKEKFSCLDDKNITYINMGKFLFSGTKRGKLRALWHLSRFNKLYCLGTDVLDGYYSETDSCTRLTLINWAALLGLDASIIGFSFNGKSKICTEEFKALHPSVRLCCRDQDSVLRLSQAIDREIIFSGDTAFLLKANEESQYVN